MADNSPSKSDIQAILKKLRSIPTNKSCFDCNAKNPTWSSVTYGVFICIDCSAVHRGLGVHVTFVRSTQLDTNWTWLQLRQMQLGGNAHAANFFRQHNCHTTDAQQKYTSRAAQLYKEKLNQMAVQAMRLHGTKLEINDFNMKSALGKSHQNNMLHLEPSFEKPDEEPKEVDFFEEHTPFSPTLDENLEKLSLNENANIVKTLSSPTPPIVNASLSKNGANGVNGGAPTVNFSASTAPPDGERKSIIGSRKPQVKKLGLGAKKGGKLGAQKVNANFAEIEREAEMMDQMKERQAEEAKILAEKTAEEEQKQMASMRLAYKDLSLQQKREEEKLRQIDPKKAQQIERLGMGFSVKSGISHSVLSDMHTIEQENTIKSSLGSKYNFDSDNNEEFFDDYNFSSCSFGMYRSENKNLDSLFMDGNLGIDRYDVKEKSEQSSGAKDFSSIKGWSSTSDSVSFNSSFDEKPARKEQERIRREPVSLSSSTTCNDAQKKFGNAKAISSDQYFGDSSANNWERKANLSRFEGSSSISSADFFGDGTSNVRHSGLTSSISAPDLDDVKESVRQGVTKVAGKISSLANGVLSSIQDRYGY